ncbi:hypothetical protein HYU92_06715 [Candidatus Curtissbacteria bacterium]|nr:hypothetical protein [Candidatus Curtissbacteria bacterium]
MAKFVPDVTTNRWVIIAEGRIKRPSDVKPGTGVDKFCIFCPGYEKIPGVELYRTPDGEPSTVGWKVRVIANKYPITDFHEVIIHSPDDVLDLDKLSLDQVHQVLLTFKERFNYNAKNGHVLIFNNVGEAAGASISHPHSQLVVIPKQINLDTLAFEPVMNVIEESSHFCVFCPEFSQWPFETWIAPKNRGKYFGETSAEEVSDLAAVLQNTLRRLITHLTRGSHFHPGVPAVVFKNGPAYNFYIYHGQDWYIRIIPRLIHRAGFELGTGLSVNIIDPADAAVILKEEIK